MSFPVGPAIGSVVVRSVVVRSVAVRSVAVRVGGGVIRRVSGKKVERVADHVEDGIEAFSGAARRTGGVDYQRCPTGTGDGSGQPPERADKPHRLGESRRLAVDHVTCSLGREVSRGEPGSPRRHDQTGEPVTEFLEDRGNFRSAILGDPVLDDIETRFFEPLDQDGSTAVLSHSRVNTVADRQHLRSSSRRRAHRQRP